MDRSTLTQPPREPQAEPRSPGRRLVVGPIGDLIRHAPRGVAFGTPPSGIVSRLGPPARGWPRER